MEVPNFSNCTNWGVLEWCSQSDVSDSAAEQPQAGIDAASFQAHTALHSIMAKGNGKKLSNGSSLTWKLARMNLAIRGIDANLGPRNADSFHADLHPDLKADFILANPPFKMRDWGWRIPAAGRALEIWDAG
jgi:hypothetical protein